MKQIVKVEGMMCVNCERRVCNVLSQLDGVVDVIASSSAKEVVVEYDDTILSLPQIEDHIETIGYQVIK